MGWIGRTYGRSFNGRCINDLLQKIYEFYKPIRKEMVLEGKRFGVEWLRHSAPGPDRFSSSGETDKRIFL